MSPATASDFNTAEARNHECVLGRGDRMTEAEQHMRRAIELAERGRHRVMPNPLVGCVLVKEGEVVAEGWHDHLGGLHAEQMAIADAEAKGISTRGALPMSRSSPAITSGGPLLAQSLSSGQEWRKS